MWKYNYNYQSSKKKRKIIIMVLEIKGLSKDNTQDRNYKRKHKNL